MAQLYKNDSPVLAAPPVTPYLVSNVGTLAGLKEALYLAKTNAGTGVSAIITIGVSATITLDDSNVLSTGTVIIAYYNAGKDSIIAEARYIDKVSNLVVTISNNAVSRVTKTNIITKEDLNLYENNLNSVLTIDSLSELKDRFEDHYDNDYVSYSPLQFAVSTAFVTDNGITIPQYSCIYTFGNDYDSDGYFGIIITPTGGIMTLKTNYPTASTMSVNAYAVGGNSVTVDQTYNGTSTNPQSGTAVAGALAPLTPDQTYNKTSTKPQSGTAVAGALGWEDVTSSVNKSQATGVASECRLIVLQNATTVFVSADITFSSANGIPLWGVPASTTIISGLPTPATTFKMPIPAIYDNTTAWLLSFAGGSVNNFTGSSIAAGKRICFTFTYPRQTA